MTTSKSPKIRSKRLSKIVDPAREARLLAQREKDAIKARERLALRQKFTALRDAKNAKKASIPHKLTKILSNESEERNDRGRREKIMRYRRAQSRYKLPKITIDDDLEDIAANMASLETRISTNNISVDGNISDDVKQPENNPMDFDSDGGLSIVSVDTMVLSDEQERSMIELEVALEAADPEFYGFIPFKKFLKILVDNNIELSLKQETYILGALILLDEGVDYCSFIRSVRELGTTLLEDTTLSEIIQELADAAESNSKQKPAETKVVINESENIVEEVNEADLEQFMLEYRTRDRGLSLKNSKHLTANIPKSSKLGLLISDLLLDGAMVDFALLKTAFAMIDENPADSDLKYLIRYLSETSANNSPVKDEIVDDDINNIEIDFNYFLSFLQETTSTPVQNMKRITPVIAKIVKQMKIVKRAEDRRAMQMEKAKQRLEQRNTQKYGQKAKNEMAELVKEEKRLMRLRLRDEAMKRYR